MGALRRPLGPIHFFMCATRVLRWGSKKLRKHLKTNGFSRIWGPILGDQSGPCGKKSALMQRGAHFAFLQSVLMQRSARFAFLEGAPMQRGARFAFCGSALMQRGARPF